jgi:hypothetical protein
MAAPVGTDFAIRSQAPAHVFRQRHVSPEIDDSIEIIIAGRVAGGQAYRSSGRGNT